MDKSYSENHDNGYISFTADHRELDNIPDYPGKPYSSNDLDIVSLNDAQNFLYLINPDEYSDREDFLDSIRETNYDVIILDAFYDESLITAKEVASLKTKSNGGQRLVIAYMSIGEAEDYRYYWQDSWNNNEPSWIEEENPYWEGNYKVRYWERGWQEIIYGIDEAYLQLILDAGYDGVYLDIIDAFEYFEEND
nr:endo alpha-1,4 polygalactosaminidase [Methanohalophilus levihalophilus]